jgi:hypothetical protein
MASVSVQFLLKVFDVKLSTGVALRAAPGYSAVLAARDFRSHVQGETNFGSATR